MKIETAKEVNGGIMLNGVTFLQDGNEGHVFVSYSEWLAEGNTPDPIDTPTLDELKSIKRKSLRVNCRDAIKAPFQSSALGTPHLYDCRRDDQQNITIRLKASEFDGLTKKVWSHDGTEFIRQPHTTAQLSQVVVDMEIHIDINQDNLEVKIALVNAAVDSTAIDAVTW